MKVITAPEKYTCDATNEVSVFLAGGIQNVTNWQEIVIKKLDDSFEHLPVVIFNPRRAVYPKDDKRAMIEQITWEHRYLADSDIFSMYFAPGESVQPICMFEYGTYLTKTFFNGDWQRFVVCADTKYSRFDDVVIQTSLVNPDIFVCGHLDDHIRRIETAIFAELKRKSLISF